MNKSKKLHESLLENLSARENGLTASLGKKALEEGAGYFITVENPKHSMAYPFSYRLFYDDGYPGSVGAYIQVWDELGRISLERYKEKPEGGFGSEGPPNQFAVFDSEFSAIESFAEMIEEMAKGYDEEKEAQGDFTSRRLSRIKFYADIEKYEGI